MITEGQLRLISRYYAGRGREFAFLELAQEHLLEWMVREVLFEGDPDDVVFKGGTAIRKFRLGRRGRFSTDFDFAIAQDAFGEHVIVALEQGLIQVDNVRFEARSVDLPAAKAIWVAVVDGVGTTMPSKLEFTRRSTLLPPIIPAARPEIGGVTPDLLGFEPPLIPLMRLEENLAEKLARFRRVIRSRDVYDLAEMGHLVRGQLDLVRQVLCFKVYLDIVRDGRESAVPFGSGPEFVGRTAGDHRPGRPRPDPRREGRVRAHAREDRPCLRTDGCSAGRDRIPPRDGQPGRPVLGRGRVHPPTHCLSRVPA